MWYWHIHGKMYHDDGWGEENVHVEFSSEKQDIKDAIDEALGAGVFDIEKVERSSSSAPEIDFESSIPE